VVRHSGPFASHVARLRFSFLKKMKKKNTISLNSRKAKHSTRKAAPAASHSGMLLCPHRTHTLRAKRHRGCGLKYLPYLPAAWAAACASQSRTPTPNAPASPPHHTNQCEKFSPRLDERHHTRDETRTNVETVVIFHDLPARPLPAASVEIDFARRVLHAHATKVGCQIVLPGVL
jgi:hypothetical protein